MEYNWYSRCGNLKNDDTNSKMSSLSPVFVAQPTPEHYHGVINLWASCFDNIDFTMMKNDNGDNYDVDAAPHLKCHGILYRMERMCGIVNNTNIKEEEEEKRQIFKQYPINASLYGRVVWAWSQSAQWSSSMQSNTKHQPKAKRVIDNNNNNAVIAAEKSQEILEHMVK
eukprot:4858295-Ditylum_brightwellii.AAC.1